MIFCRYLRRSASRSAHGSLAVLLTVLFVAGAALAPASAQSGEPGSQSAQSAALDDGYRSAIEKRLAAEFPENRATIAALDFETGPGFGSGSDSGGDDPVSAYLSRRLPEALLSRIPDIDFRILPAIERSNILSYVHETERSAQLLAWSRNARADALSRLGGGAGREPVRPWEGYFSPRAPEIALGLVPTRVLVTALAGSETGNAESSRASGRGIAGTITPPSPADFAGAKANYLLTGSIQELSGSEDWLWIEYRVWSRYGGEPVLEGAFAANLQSALETASAQARGLAEEFGGQKLASWEIRILPPDYQILVNGRSAGFGAAADDLALPGTYLLEAAYRGRVVHRETRELKPGASAVWFVNAGPLRADFVRILSEPAGAEVLVDGRRIGVTPLDAAFLPQQRVLAIEADGFRPWSIPLDSQTRRLGLSAELLDDSIDWKAYIDGKRDLLYTALGLTALSATVPIVLNGFFSEAYIVARRDGGNPAAFSTANNLFIARNIGLGVFGAGALVSLITLVDYLEAVKKVTH